jgi:hypothetical protein
MVQPLGVSGINGIELTRDLGKEKRTIEKIKKEIHQGTEKGRKR